MKIELTNSECSYLSQYISEHGYREIFEDIKFHYQPSNNSYIGLMNSVSYKRLVDCICNRLIECDELDEELFAIYSKIKRQEIVYEQSLRHTINALPLIVGDEGAYQYIEALSRALTYSQHALTKHQIALIDTIIARISGQE